MVKLLKSEFAQATVPYLAQTVGKGHVASVHSKVQAILDFPVPENKKALHRFISMVMFYKSFAPNQKTILTPLTNMTSPKVQFNWTILYQESFAKVKQILINHPILMSPDYTKEFQLFVDSLDARAGAVRIQEGSDRIDRAICYYSKKLNKRQKELLHTRERSTSTTT